MRVQTNIELEKTPLNLAKNADKIIPENAKGSVRKRAADNQTLKGTMVT